MFPLYFFVLTRFFIIDFFICCAFVYNNRIHYKLGGYIISQVTIVIAIYRNISEYKLLKGTFCLTLCDINISLYTLDRSNTIVSNRLCATCKRAVHHGYAFIPYQAVCLAECRGYISACIRSNRVCIV